MKRIRTTTWKRYVVGLALMGLMFGFGAQGHADLVMLPDQHRAIFNGAPHTIQNWFPYTLQRDYAQLVTAYNAWSGLSGTTGITMTQSSTHADPGNFIAMAWISNSALSGIAKPITYVASGGHFHVSHYHVFTNQNFTAASDPQYRWVNWSDNTALGMYCHEIGHTLGLGHHSGDDGRCLSQSFPIQENFPTPPTHELAALDDFYDTHGVHASLDTPSRPTAYASWVGAPRDIGAMEKAADTVVVGEVVAVSPGPDEEVILLPVDLHPDGIDDDLPTERVVFKVQDQFKGEESDSLLIYRLGGESLKFSEIPDYIAGEQYLLYLTPHQSEEGTMRLVSPSGRFYVHGGKVAPVVNDDRVTKFTNQSVQDVVAEGRRIANTPED